MPPIFTEATRDSAAGCVALFDSTTENPELIWNDETREKVKRVIQEELDKLFACQKDEPDYTWKVGIAKFCKFNLQILRFESRIANIKIVRSENHSKPT